MDNSSQYHFRERVAKSNQVFRYYRLALSALLIIFYFVSNEAGTFRGDQGSAFLNASMSWFALVIISSLAARFLTRSGNHVNSFNFLADMIFLAFLGYASGGVESGIFYLMLPSAALAGLTTPYRLALFVAAVAAIAVLYAQSLIAMQQDTGNAPFISAGMLGALLFGSTIAFRYLENRLRSVEERAYEEQVFKEEARSILGLVVSPQVAETLIGKNIQLGGSEREVSIMFTDIRNFTSLSSQLTASETLSMLNNYFSCLTEQIENNLGVVDKYMGDGAMAFFGAPARLKGHANRSVLSALQLQLAIQQLDSDSQFFGLNIETGIGITTGNAVVGNLGSNSRLNYTAVGETVNLAARLEQLTKIYRIPIVVSEATREAATDFFYREIDLVTVRGIEGYFPVYQPLAKNSLISETQRQDMESYSQAIQLFRNKEWLVAKEIFETLSDSYQDGLCQLYAETCDYLADNAPPEDWAGSLMMVAPSFRLG